MTSVGNSITILHTKDRTFCIENATPIVGDIGTIVHTPDRTIFLSKTSLNVNDQCTLFSTSDGLFAHGLAAAPTSQVKSDTHIDKSWNESNYCNESFLLIGDKDGISGEEDKYAYMEFNIKSPNWFVNASEILLHIYVTDHYKNVLTSVTECESRQDFNACALDWNNESEYFNTENCSHVGNLFPSWETGILLEEPPTIVVG